MSTISAEMRLQFHIQGAGMLECWNARMLECWDAGVYVFVKQTFKNDLISDKVTVHELCAAYEPFDLYHVMKREM